MMQSYCNNNRMYFPKYLTDVFLFISRPALPESLHPLDLLIGVLTSM